MRLINHHPDKNNMVTVHTRCQLACSSVEGTSHVCNLNHISNPNRPTSPQPSTSTTIPWREAYEPSTIQYQDASMPNELVSDATNYVEWQENREMEKNENEDKEDENIENENRKENENKVDGNGVKRKSPRDDDSLSDSKSSPKIFKNNEGEAQPSQVIEPPFLEYTVDEFNPFEFGIFEHTSRELIPAGFNPVQYAPGVFAPSENQVNPYDNKSMENAYDPDEFVPDVKTHTKDNDTSDAVSIISITSSEPPSPGSGSQDITFNEDTDDEDYVEETIDEEEDDTSSDSSDDDSTDEDSTDEDSSDEEGEDGAVTSTTTDTNDGGISCSIY